MWLQSPKACLGSFSGVSHYSKHLQSTPRGVQLSSVAWERCATLMIKLWIQLHIKQHCLSNAFCASPASVYLHRQCNAAWVWGVSQWWGGLAARRERGRAALPPQFSCLSCLPFGKNCLIGRQWIWKFSGERIKILLSYKIHKQAIMFTVSCNFGRLETRHAQICCAFVSGLTFECKAFPEWSNSSKAPTDQTCSLWSFKCLKPWCKFKWSPYGPGYEQKVIDGRRRLTLL